MQLPHISFPLYMQVLLKTAFFFFTFQNLQFLVYKSKFLNYRKAVLQHIKFFFQLLQRVFTQNFKPQNT